MIVLSIIIILILNFIPYPFYSHFYSYSIYPTKRVIRFESIDYGWTYWKQPIKHETSHQCQFIDFIFRFQLLSASKCYKPTRHGILIQLTWTFNTNLFISSPFFSFKDKFCSNVTAKSVHHHENNVCMRLRI